MNMDEPIMTPLTPIESWPNYIHRKLRDDWTLSTTCVENCECYYLRHWQLDYFMSRLTHDAGSDFRLFNEGHEYIVRMKDTAARIAENTQVRLSFRKPKKELNLPAYVLVKGM